MFFIKYLKTFLKLNVLLHIYFLWSHYFLVVAPSANINSLNAFKKLFEKNATRSQQVNLQTSVFPENVVITRTAPPGTMGTTSALPVIPDSISAETLQTVVVISDRKETIETVSSVSPEARIPAEQINATENDFPKNKSQLLEEVVPGDNKTANATLASTEAEQAGGESEVMPSFDEWKRHKLAEQNIKGEKVAQPASPQKKAAGQKRRRNYASYECGAKVVAANPEAESTSRILNEQMDEYMLNPCHAKIWFVIELCETIQVTQIEIANLELFSSSPKDLNIYWSDRFPTRDWTPLGSFVAQDHRTFQSFLLQQQGYGKFMKIEMPSHYSTEHYCPLSVVRVYGTSMVDEYEEMETVQHSLEDEEDRLDLPAYEGGGDATSKDLFGSAKEAVMNMYRKAAQALTRDSQGATINATDSSLLMNEEVGDSRDGNVTERFHEHLVKCGMCCIFDRTPIISNATYCQFLQSVLNASTLKRLCKLRFCYCQIPTDPDHLEEKPARRNDTVHDTVANVSVQSEDVVHPAQTHDNMTVEATLSSQEQLPVSTVDVSTSFEHVTPPAPLPPSQHPPLRPSVEEVTVVSSTSSVNLSSQEIVIQPSTVSPVNPSEETTPKIVNETWESQYEPAKHSGNNGGATAAQKESVFVRLNNRIRGLETNLSLSTLYLQELSQRYRRQMEDMQRVFNRTVASLNETAHRAAEKDLRQQEQIAALSESVERMTREMETIYKQVYEAHLFMIVTEVIVMVTILSLCLRRVALAASPKKTPAPVMLYSSPLKRHCSVSSLHSTYPGEKKRRSSGDFSPSGSYSHLMIVEPAVPIFLEPLQQKVKKKQSKNKKMRHLRRSASNPNLATFDSSHSKNNNENEASLDRPTAARQGACVPFQNLSNGILERAQQPKNCDKGDVV